MSMELRDFLKFNINNTLIYSPEQIDQLCKDVFSAIKPKLYKKRGGAKIYNIPCSFDIETSSFYLDGKKCACMYIWSMSICGLVVLGVTWEEFINTLEGLKRGFDLVLGEKHLIIYVQSLSYEFQWFRKWLEWADVFATDNRTPIHATTTYGIEFKCSYVLSAFNLRKMGEHLIHIPVQKTDGLEYYVKRLPNVTPITWTEIRYSVNDVQVVVSFIYDEMVRNKYITRIPLTNTGYVRAFCRKACLQGFENDIKNRGFKRFRYMSFISNLALTPDEYKQSRRAFAGGFTHTNPFYAGMELYGVTSEDFISAYPAEIVKECQFPMSRAELVETITTEIFNESIECYFCLFDLIIEDVEATFLYDNYISYSKCWLREDVTVANGRVVKAKRLGLTICNIDYEIIREVYSWGDMYVTNLRRYKRGYLPTDFVKAVLSLYGDKTTLKGVPEMQAEYQNKKGMANATYGMACQAVFRDLNTYEHDEWTIENVDENAEIERYNNSSNRFLFYPWAICITACCRRDLWSGIIEFGSDYVYSDTDSIKVLNVENHTEYLKQYNEHISKQCLNASKHHKISYDLFKPKTIKGVEKHIGYWDFDGFYSIAKFLRAKCYMVEHLDLNTGDREIEMTVSGVNKKVATPYLLEKYGLGIWDAFSDKLTIPKGKTGKLIHTYIDEEISGTTTDYLGNVGTFHELSCVHLEETSYCLSIAQEYTDYILQIRDKE